MGVCNAAMFLRQLVWHARKDAARSLVPVVGSPFIVQLHSLIGKLIDHRATVRAGCRALAGIGGSM